MLDQAHDIRRGEEPDLPALEKYLREHLDGFERILEARQFPGGYSNLTYLLRTNAGDFVMRRPPFGANIKGGHDMGREFRVLSLLAGVYPRAPQPVLSCGHDAVLGAPFYLMTRVEGIILRSRPPAGLDLGPGRMRAISEATVDNLADLHAIDIRAHGLDQLGKPEGYVERQARGWAQRYYQAQTDRIGTMDEVARWMEANLPADGLPALIHNDYKYDNLVLHPQRPEEIIAVLDWEMATVGDPLMDLGTSLAYWSEPNEARAMQLAASNLTWLPGNLNRQEMAERYAARSGRNLDNLIFYYVYGAFKVGVILQQIFARYKKGHTRDTRFAGLIGGVRYFGDLAARAIDRQRISDLL